MTDKTEPPKNWVDAFQSLLFYAFLSIFVLKCFELYLNTKDLTCFRGVGV